MRSLLSIRRVGRSSPKSADHLSFRHRCSACGLVVAMIAVAALSSGCVVAKARVDGNRRTIESRQTAEPNGRSWRLVAIDRESGRYALEREYRVDLVARDEVEIVERRSWPVTSGPAYWIADVLGAKYISPVLIAIMTPFCDAEIGHLGLPVLGPPPALDASPRVDPDQRYTPLLYAYSRYYWNTSRSILPVRAAASATGIINGVLSPVPGFAYGVVTASPLDLFARIAGHNTRVSGGMVFSMLTPPEAADPELGSRKGSDGSPVTEPRSIDAKRAYVEDVNYWQNLAEWPLRWMPFYPGFSDEYAMETEVVGTRTDVRRESSTDWRRDNRALGLSADVHVFIGDQPLDVAWNRDGSFAVSDVVEDLDLQHDGAVWMWWEDERGERRRDFSQLEGTWAKNRERLRQYEDRALDTPRIRLAAKQR